MMLIDDCMREPISLPSVFRAFKHSIGTMAKRTVERSREALVLTRELLGAAW